MDTLKKKGPKKKRTRRQADLPAQAQPGREEKYTPAQIIKAIMDGNGMLAAAARILGCSRSTVYNYADRYPEIRDAIVEAAETTTDFVEGKLIEQIRGGNITAIIFYLKTKAKARGYVERTEHSGPDGKPLIPAQRTRLDDLSDEQLITLEKARQIVDDAFADQDPAQPG